MQLVNENAQKVMRYHIQIFLCFGTKKIKTMTKEYER